MHALIVEDEIRLAQNIQRVLEREMSFAVDICSDGQEGLSTALLKRYDLIILDLSLPSLDGIEILKSLRSEGIATPVLILTARSNPSDMVQGLDLGCDDYLTKPFDMDILIARCRALVRRCYEKASASLTVGNLTIDTAAHRVIFNEEPVIVPGMEYRLLEYLAMRGGQIVSKADIEDHLYSYGAEVESNVVEVYISSLRRRFDPTPPYKLIHTVRGQGYLLEHQPS